MGVEASRLGNDDWEPPPPPPSRRSRPSRRAYRSFQRALNRIPPPPPRRRPLAMRRYLRQLSMAPPNALIPNALDAFVAPRAASAASVPIPLPVIPPMIPIRPGPPTRRGYDAVLENARHRLPPEVLRNIYTYAYNPRRLPPPRPPIRYQDDEDVDSYEDPYDRDNYR